jgi:hypothetical protein
VKFLLHPFHARSEAEVYVVLQVFVGVSLPPTHCSARLTLSVACFSIAARAEADRRHGLSEGIGHTRPG